MTIKTFLGVGDSVRVGTDTSTPLSIATQSLSMGELMGFLKNTVIPSGYTAILSIVLRYRRTGTGNLYLQFASSQTVPTPGATPIQDSDDYTVHAGGAADNSMGSITVPAAAYDALTSFAVGDILGIAVNRDATNPFDTYTTDLEVYGFLVTFSDNVVEPTNGAYCSQTDLENRIGVLQLARLTNDAANPTEADPVVVAAIINKSDREIDGKAGQVYNVPFLYPTTCDYVPSVVSQISIDTSIYYCFLRRYSQMEVPKQWIDLYNKAQKDLEAISNQELPLDGNPQIASEEADIVSPELQLDFNDPSSPMSMY